MNGCRGGQISPSIPRRDAGKGQALRIEQFAVGHLLNHAGGFGQSRGLAEHLLPDHPTENHQAKPSQSQCHGSHCNEGLCFYVFTVLHLWHAWPQGRENGPAPQAMPTADGSRLSRQHCFPLVLVTCSRRPENQGKHDINCQHELTIVGSWWYCEVCPFVPPELSAPACSRLWS